MRILLTLLAKETKALFSSPIAYAVIAVFLLLMGYSFTAFLFLNKTSSLVHLFFQAAVLFLLIVPVLTMRQFAEERKTGTLELLLTAPVREIDIVLAKFLASMAVNAGMLALTLTYAWCSRRMESRTGVPSIAATLALCCSQRRWWRWA